MELTDAINGRRAVRDYTLAAVGEREIRDLIDAAVRAPSATSVAPIIAGHPKSALAAVPSYAAQIRWFP